MSRKPTEHKIHIYFCHSFEYLEDMMKRSSGWGRLQAYMLNELQPLYDRLGFEASSTKPLKMTLIKIGEAK